MKTCILMAGGLHFLIVAANFFLPDKLNVKQNLLNVPKMIRQIYNVHSIYIVLIVLFFTSLCFFFPEELMENQPLGRFLTGFIALFWLLRLPIQLFYYDRAVLRKHWIAHIFFSFVFAYLGILFSSITLGVYR